MALHNNNSHRNTCGNSITLAGILVAIQLLSQEYLWQFNYSHRNTCGNSITHRNTCDNSITLTGILVAIQLLSQEYLRKFNLMSSENISEKFGRSNHLKNIKFENFCESRNHLGYLQWSLLTHYPVIPMAWSVRHVAMSSKNWLGPVKSYSLLDQMTSRNLSTSSVEYVNVL